MFRVLADVDPLAWVAGISTAVAALVGAYAALVAKRTEWRTASRAETEQALQAQDGLLNQYRTRMTEMRAEFREQLDGVRSELAEVRSQHEACEERLRRAGL